MSQSYLDARYDSTRFAYHGTVVIIHTDTGHVIEVVNMTRKEARNSWKFKDQATKQALSKLSEQGVCISEIFHDDKHVVDDILSRYNIISQKDLRHKCTNMVKKIKIDLLKKVKAPPNIHSIDDCTSYD